MVQGNEHRAWHAAAAMTVLALQGVAAQRAIPALAMHEIWETVGWGRWLRPAACMLPLATRHV